MARLSNDGFLFSHNGNFDFKAPCVLVVTGSDVWGDAYTLDGWFQKIHNKYINQGIGVVYFGRRQSQNKPSIFYSKYIREHAKTKNDNVEDFKKYNNELVDHWVKDMFGRFNIIRVMVLCAKDTSILPLSSYVSKTIDSEAHERKNEFHDSINPVSIELIEKIDLVVKELLPKRLGITAFSTIRPKFCFSVISWLMNSNDVLKVDVFLIDPTPFYSWFMQWGDSRCRLFYFSDDNRGTRNFVRFPIDYLQHAVYDLSRITPMSTMFENHTNSKNLIFAGTILHTKGSRIHKWKQYLEQFNDSLSDYFIPKRANGINQSMPEYEKQLLESRKANPHIYDSVVNHPNFNSVIKPDTMAEIMPQYKYGLVLKCVSYYDSLNFRPVLYTMHGVLPLLDPEYDPDYLQIPKTIQDKLLVHNHEDLNNKIKWFNAHPDERNGIINDLYDILVKPHETFDAAAYFEELRNFHNV